MKTISIKFPLNRAEITGDYSRLMRMPEEDRHLYYVEYAFLVGIAHNFIPEKVIVSYYSDDRLLHRGYFQLRKVPFNCVKGELLGEQSLSAENIGIIEWLDG